MTSFKDMKTLYESLFPQEDELTRYGFMSHMEAYIKQLLQDPRRAKIDDYLKSHGLDEPTALKALLKRTDPSDPNSAVLLRTEKIKPVEMSEEEKAKGVVPKDRFCIKYKLPRKDYHKKMRNLYISMFESNIVEGCPIEKTNLVNEEGEGGCMADMGGATNASSSGQFIQPLNKDVIRRKTVYITQEQCDKLREAVEMGTAFGDFGYDAPIGDGKKNKGNKFFDAANDHENMIEKSIQK